MESIEKYLAPIEVGKLIDATPAKVLNLIHTGQLVAVNTAVNLSGRPRYKVAESSVRAFIEARTTTKAV